MVDKFTYSLIFCFFCTLFQCNLMYEVKHTIFWVSNLNILSSLTYFLDWYAVIGEAEFDKNKIKYHQCSLICIIYLGLKGKNEIPVSSPSILKAAKSCFVLCNCQYQVKCMPPN